MRSIRATANPSLVNRRNGASRVHATAAGGANNVMVRSLEHCSDRCGGRPAQSRNQTPLAMPNSGRLRPEDGPEWPIDKGWTQSYVSENLPDRPPADACTRAAQNSAA